MSFISLNSVSLTVLLQTQTQ